MENKIILYLVHTVNKHYSLIVGSTGAGKTQNVILPTILYNLSSQQKPKMVISNSKDDILKAIKKTALKHQYNIFTLYFINFSNNKWNPLMNIQKLWNNNNKFDQAKALIQTYINSLVSNIKSNKDPVWHLRASNLLIAIVIAWLINNYKPNRNDILTCSKILYCLNKDSNELINWLVKYNLLYENSFLSLCYKIFNFITQTSY